MIARRRQGAAGRVLVSSVGQIVTMAIAVVSTTVTARWLGPSGRGGLSLITTGASLAALLLSFGAYQTLSTFVARRELSVRKALLISVALSAFVGIASAVVLFAAQRPDITIGMGVVLILGATAVVFGMCQTAVATGIGRLDIVAANTVTTSASTLVGYVIGSAFASSPTAALWVAAWAWVMAQVIGDMVGWTWLLQATPKNLPSQRVPLRQLMRFSFAAYPAAVVGQLNARADIMVLGVLASTSEVGIYSVATVASTLLFVVPSAIGSAMTKTFGEVEDAGGIARMSAVLAVVSVLVLGPVLILVLTAFAAPLLGDGFSDIGRLVAILAPGSALFSIAYPASGYFGTAVRRPILSAYPAVVAVVADLAILSFIGGRYGAAGAAAASSFGYGAGGLVSGVMLWRISSGQGGNWIREDVEQLRRFGSGLKKLIERSPE